jgi:hypothetical protein
MDIRRYYRAVTVALNTKHLDWAAYFIEKYKDNLREDFREDAYHNNSAKVLFEQGRFHDMKDRLKIDNKQNPYITMAVYRLHLKTYWVLEDVDLLARYLGKYKQYLKKLKQEQNTTLRSNNLERNENFLKALNKLNKIKGLSKLTLREAKTEFEKKYMKGLLTEKKWLMAIFNAL